MTTGHVCLAKHLHHIGILLSLDCYCIFCIKVEIFKNVLSLRNEAFKYNKIVALGDKPPIVALGLVNPHLNNLDLLIKYRSHSKESIQSGFMVNTFIYISLSDFSLLFE